MFQNMHAGHVKRLIHWGAALLLTALSLPQAAMADPTLYSDASAFAGAVSNETTRDFNQSSGYGGTGQGLGTFADNGVTFSTSNNYLYSLGPVSCGSGCQWGNDYGTGNYLYGPSWPDSFTASMSASSGYTAFGMDLLLDNDTGARTYGEEALGLVDITIGLASGAQIDTSVDVTAFDQFYFFGVTSPDDAIVSLTFSPPNLAPAIYCAPSVCYNGLSASDLVIDNVSTGMVPSSDANGAAVPEPDSLALVAAALGGLALIRRRRGR